MQNGKEYNEMVWCPGGVWRMTEWMKWTEAGNCQGKETEQYEYTEYELEVSEKNNESA